MFFMKKEWSKSFLDGVLTGAVDTPVPWNTKYLTMKLDKRIMITLLANIVLKR